MPGARLGREFGRVLLPRDHRDRSRAHERPFRTLHFARAQRAAGHRRRFRAPAARGSGAVRLPQIRTRPRGHRGHRRLLPPAQRRARHRQGAGARARAGRPSREIARLVGQPLRDTRAAARRRLRSGQSRDAAVGRARRDARRLSAASLAARGRFRDLARTARRARPDRERRDARAQRDPVGQGRPRRAEAAESRRARARHALGHPARARADPPGQAGGLDHACDHRPARRSQGVRNDPQGRHDRRLPDRIARADVDAAAA